MWVTSWRITKALDSFLYFYGFKVDLQMVQSQAAFKAKWHQHYCQFLCPEQTVIAYF